MLKKIFLTAALSVFMLLPLASASAKHRHGHGHAYAFGRRNRTAITHWDDRNPTPGIPRRVARGRNWTPGTSRGDLDRTPTTFPRDEGRRLGRDVERREDRGVGRGEDRGVGRGVGMGIGGGVGRGRGHGKH
jgi:hypothetical protein